MTTINNTCRSSRLPSLQHLARQTVAALAISIATALSAQVGPPQVLTGAYDIEDLGTLAGYSLATGINRRGDVAGYAYNSQQVSQAFHFDAPSGPAQYLAPISYGLAINDAGVLAGDRAIPRSAAARIRRFAWSATPSSWCRCLPASVQRRHCDQQQQRSRRRCDTYMARRAYVNTSAGTLDLGTLGGNSYARGINDDTEVVGYSEPPGFVSTDPNWDIGHAFYWDQNLGMVDLNDLIYRPTPQSLANLYDFRKASAINRHHQIVGMAASPALNVIRAFRSTVSPTRRSVGRSSLRIQRARHASQRRNQLRPRAEQRRYGRRHGVSRCERPWKHPGRIVREWARLQPERRAESARFSRMDVVSGDRHQQQRREVGWGQKTVEGQLTRSS